MATEDFAENTIIVYQLGNLSQFSDEGNHQSAIKSGFSTYLREELEISDVSIKENKINCKIGTDIVIFTVTKNDIKYSVK